jgi:biopolymer transport protein ExbD
MVATRFEEFERNIDVTVPEVVEAGMTSAPQRPIIVSVFHDGHVELDGLTVSLDELTVRLTDARHRHGNPTVVIRGDAACPFQHVAGALAACRMANVSELGITVRLAGVADSSSPR